MVQTKEPTHRAKRFGQRLRDLREASGFTVAEVGEYLRRGQSTVTRFERGQYPVTGDELFKLLNLYRVSDPDERASFLRAADEVNQRGWHEGIITNRGFADFVWSEERALAMKVFQLDTIPGILQSEEFARELLQAGPQRATEVESLVEARMMRSRILSRANPPEARFLLHENALRQRGASAEVTVVQMKRLTELAGLANVRLRVLPASSWAHTAAGITGSFRVLNAHEDWPDLLYVETPVGGVVYEGPDIDSTVEAFDRIWDQDAWDETYTTEYIATVSKEVSR